MSESRTSRDWDDLDRLLHLERALGPITRSVTAVITRSGSWYLLIWEGQHAFVKQVGANKQRLTEPRVHQGRKIFMNSETNRIVLHDENDVWQFQTSPVVEERAFDLRNNHAVCRITRFQV